MSCRVSRAGGPRPCNQAQPVRRTCEGPLGPLGCALPQRSRCPPGRRDASPAAGLGVLRAAAVAHIEGARLRLQLCQPSAGRLQLRPALKRCRWCRGLGITAGIHPRHATSSVGPDLGMQFLSVCMYSGRPSDPHLQLQQGLLGSSYQGSELGGRLATAARRRGRRRRRHLQPGRQPRRRR